MHNSKFSLLEWLSSCAVQAVLLSCTSCQADLCQHSSRIELMQPAEHLSCWPHHVCSKQSKAQAVQVMGGPQSLAEAVYQHCQPEPGIFRCPNCGRKSGSDICQLKKRCWSDKKSGCLECTVQVGCCVSNLGCIESQSWVSICTTGEISATHLQSKLHDSQVFSLHLKVLAGCMHSQQP